MLPPGAHQKRKRERYYSCVQRRKKENPCTKKTIRKEIIEDIVVKATLKAFENPDAIEKFFMIRTLVKQVILYDDRAVIQYNCTTDNPDGDDHWGFCFHTETVYPEHKLYGTSYGSSTVKFIVELYA